jgi:tRNA A37 threonylcarbamoyladenosine biosynthesis protein TsaE
MNALFFVITGTVLRLNCHLLDQMHVPLSMNAQLLVIIGTVLLLNGHLGAGKSTICRGFVRAACKDRTLDVPSPTFLLCLSYSEDQGHHNGRKGKDNNKEALLSSAAAASSCSLGCTDDTVDDMQQGCAPTVHHMDPYRLGAKADKMAGLIDFEAAFQHDVCLIEWPDRMPAGETVKEMCTKLSGHTACLQVRLSGRCAPN